MLRKIWHVIKRIIGIVCILLVLAIIGITIFILTFDLNRYKELVAQKLSLVLDRPVKIESMHTKLSLIPTISIQGVEIQNKEPFQDKAPLLKIKQMDAELELAPLINTQVNIHKITLKEAQINLIQTDKDSNWTLPAQEKQTPSKEGKVEIAKADLQKIIHLNTVSIDTLNVNYKNTKQTYKLVFNNIELKSLQLLSGEMTYNNQKFNFNLNAGTLFDIMNKKQNFPLDLKIKSRLVNITLNGKIGDIQKLTGLQATTTIRTDNLKNLLAFLGIKNSLIPTQNTFVQIQATGSADKLTLKQLALNINSEKDLVISGTGTLNNVLTTPQLVTDFNLQLLDNQLTNLWKIQPMTIKGDLTVSPSHIKSNVLTIDANRSDIRLAADIHKKNTVWNVSTAIAANFLNIYDIIKKKTDSNKTESTSTAKTTTTFSIPWENMKKVNMNLNLNINHLQITDILTDYIGIATQSTLYDGILKAPIEISMLNGKVSGNLNANAVKKTIALSTVGSNLNLDNLRLVNQEIKNVILQTKINVQTTGTKQDELLKNLNGQIIAETNQGQIINKWFSNLPKVLNLTKNKQNVTFSNTDSRVMITCAAANIQIQKGVINGKEQLALETNTLDVLAGGEINLPDRTMDVQLRPTLPEDTAEDVLNLSKYIRITGPFNNLSPRVDTKQVATDVIQAGINKLMETQQISVAPVSGAMCQNVLGKDALIKKTTTTQTKQQDQQTPQPALPKNQQAQPFQQQLLNSLFQALAPAQ